MLRPHPTLLPLSSSLIELRGSGWEDLSDSAELCAFVLEGSQAYLQHEGFHNLMCFFLTPKFVHGKEYPLPRTERESTQILSSLLAFQKGSDWAQAFCMARLAQLNPQPDEDPMKILELPEMLLSLATWNSNSTLGYCEVLRGFGGQVVGYGEIQSREVGQDQLADIASILRKDS